MTSTFGVRKRNNLFREFCKLACPGYSENSNHGRITQIALDLLGSNDVDIYELLRGVKRVLVYPEQFVVGKSEIPDIKDYLPKKESFKYKQDACRFIYENFNLSLPVSANVPGRFYDSIIQNFINHPLIKVVSLEDRLLDDLDFLNEKARHAMPPCVFGDIQRIDRAYKRLKDYFRRE